MELNAGTGGYGQQDMSGQGYQDATPFSADPISGTMTGEGAAGKEAQDECIRDACNSTKVWDYGGDGGNVNESLISSLQNTTYTDPGSCQKCS